MAWLVEKLMARNMTFVYIDLCIYKDNSFPSNEFITS